MHELKDMYDGYHFSESMQGVYNPYSVICALKEKRLRPYWIASGATEMLPKILTNFEKDVETLDGSLIDMDYIETADISKDNPKLVLYQLGILTIKDVIGEAYRLGFPNREVNRTALGGFQICRDAWRGTLIFDKENRGLTDWQEVE